MHNQNIKNAVFIFIMTIIFIVSLGMKDNVYGEVTKINLSENIVALLDENGYMEIIGKGEIPDFTYNNLPLYDYRYKIKK